MADLKYYRIEYEKYKGTPQIKDENVEKICKKLARHFNVHLRLVVINGKGNNACFGELHFRHNPPCYVICHELGHVAVHTGIKSHTKKLARFVDRAMKYCAKMGYWNMQLTEEELKVIEKAEHEKSIKTRRYAHNSNLRAWIETLQNEPNFAIEVEQMRQELATGECVFTNWDKIREYKKRIHRIYFIDENGHKCVRQWSE